MHSLNDFQEGWYFSMIFFPFFLFHGETHRIQRNKFSLKYVATGLWYRGGVDGSILIMSSDLVLNTWAAVTHLGSCEKDHGLVGLAEAAEEQAAMMLVESEPCT